ncbi:EF-hand domain-containing protein D2 homolog [Scaptodrosophila lebanonensis]|uniref:EF-hand domain-containing protein D2 homolog n=1 Tax=Drosophila lebanonensis TaxID=7225 RepID=A0A6J2THI9_DROLE|nr:EF-hand domain-containing protein D2 homolog [Scaptodrosophila lebanonensis]
MSDAEMPMPLLDETPLNCKDIDDLVFTPRTSSADLQLNEQINAISDRPMLSTPLVMVNPSTTCANSPEANATDVEDSSDLSFSSSFASCNSCINLRRALLQRNQRSSNQSVDSNFDNMQSAMSSITVQLNEDHVGDSPDDEGSKDDNENDDAEVNGCGDCHGNEAHIVLERKIIQMTDDEAASEDAMDMEEIYTKFKACFTPQAIDLAFQYFEQFDFDGDGFIVLNELKLMLEKLSVPQTHLAAKRIMNKIAGEHEEYLSFCQFLLIYAEVRNLPTQDIRSKLDHEYTEKLAHSVAVDVSAVGVSGAKRFFEAKIEQQHQQERQHSRILLAKQRKAQETEMDRLKREQFDLVAAKFKKRQSADSQ